MQKKPIRICFILNPTANRGRAVEHISWLTTAAHKRWKTVEIVLTQNHHHVSQISREKAAMYDIIVACGGDGTIHNVVQGIAETNVTLGVLPMGSGNDFAKSLNITQSLSECLDFIYHKNTLFIDLIKYSGEVSGWCTNTIGFGLDGWANYHARNVTLLRGKLPYIYGAIKAAFTFKGSRVFLENDNGSTNKPFLMVTACNGKWEGGNFYVAPNADMTDGLMNILTIEKLSIPRLLSYLPRFLRGPSQKMHGVCSFTSKKLVYYSESPVAVHADGEQVGISVRRIELNIKKNALQIIIP